MFFILCGIYLFYLPAYDEELFHYSFNHLINNRIEYHLRTMLFIMSFYLLQCCWDNNIDKKNDYDSILNKNYDSIVNSVIYKVYMNTPFITEIQTILAYIS